MSRRRIGGLDTTKTSEDEDYNSKKVRRARAYQWHSRWAMPNYKMMMHHVRTTPGLDITEEDVHLLPWGKNQRLDRREYEKLQAGTSDVDTQKVVRDMLKAEENAARRKAEEEEARRRKEAEEAERRRREAEEAERRRKEAEEAERRRKEAEEAERRRKEAEEAEKLRKEAEEAERRRREAEEAERRRKEAEMKRLEEERLRREEEERRRREEEERRRREEEERRRREEEDRRRREEEERRRREEEARLQREAEERRRKEEEERRRREAEEAERRRRQEELDARRRLPPAITDGDSPVERAYRCFTKIAKPSKDTMEAALRETDGLDIIESDIDALPWNPDGKDLDYPRLHDQMDREMRHRKMMNLWKSTGQPKKEQFKKMLYEAPVDGVISDDVSVLSWDPTGTFVIEHDNSEVDVARKRRKEMERKRIEERERQRLKEELQMKRKTRPPPVTQGNSPLERAYRWYTRLSGPKRQAFLNVVGETGSMDISKEDVDLLPWIKNGALIDFAKLGEMLDAEEKKRKDEERANSKLIILTDKERKRKKKAMEWYDVLARPTRETMYRLIDETVGMDINKEDVDLLAWDPSFNTLKRK